MSPATSTTGSNANSAQKARQELWESVHRRNNLPISHPIPKLTVTRGASAPSRLQRIEAFVQERIRTGAARLPLLTLVAALALMATACTSLSYRSPEGECFTRTAIGTASAINALEVEAGTNGVRRIVLKGFSSDSANALGVVTEAAVRAALNGK